MRAGHESRGRGMVEKATISGGKWTGLWGMRFGNKRE